MAHFSIYTKFTGTIEIAIYNRIINIKDHRFTNIGEVVQFFYEIMQKKPHNHKLTVGPVGFPRFS